VKTPVVEVELADGLRFVLEKVEPEPGFGMVTLYVHPDDDRETPDAMIVPLGSVRRFELRRAPEARVASFGFSIPKS
jgi:hypothetical protein